MHRLLTEAELSTSLEDEGGELAQFVSDIEQSISAGFHQTLTSAIDHDAILQRATSGVAPDSSVQRIRAMFERGTRSAWKQAPIARDYLGNHFKFLRPRTLRGHEGLLFRSSDDNGSLNYYLFLVGHDRGQGYRVRDIFVVGTSETLSTTLGRTFRHLVAEYGESSNGQNEVSAAFVQSLTQIAAMTNAYRADEFEKVLELYEGLPSPAKREHKVLLMRVEASEHIDRRTLNAAMSTWSANFPGDHLLPLKYIDFYFANGKYDASAEVIRNLEQELGGDSYLKFRLGEVLLAKEEIPEGLLPSWGGTIGTEGRRRLGPRRSTLRDNG